MKQQKLLIILMVILEVKYNQVGFQDNNFLIHIRIAANAINQKFDLDCGRDLREHSSICNAI